jgi:hypothetical protein
MQVGLTGAGNMASAMARVWGYDRKPALATRFAAPERDGAPTAFGDPTDAMISGGPR